MPAAFHALPLMEIIPYTRRTSTHPHHKCLNKSAYLSLLSVVVDTFRFFRFQGLCANWPLIFLPTYRGWKKTKTHTYKHKSILYQRSKKEPPDCIYYTKKNYSVNPMGFFTFFKSKKVSAKTWRAMHGILQCTASAVDITCQLAAK